MYTLETSQTQLTLTWVFVHYIHYIAFQISHETPHAAVHGKFRSSNVPLAFKE